MACTRVGRLGFQRCNKNIVSATLPVLSRALHGTNAAQVKASPQPVSQPAGDRVVTMVPGDGVWPELMVCVKEVFKAARVPIIFEEKNLSELFPQNSLSLDEVVESIRKNSICLKGILNTPSAYNKGELQTLNHQLRKRLDMFANVVHAKSIPGLSTRHNGLDCIIIREQTEGEFSALEHESVTGVVESLKIITEDNSRRIAKFAFDYATRHGRKKVTAVHKANIMKLSDGLFASVCKDVSSLYPEIEFDSMLVDNTCMQLVKNPYQFDVMVMPNLYGQIIDNLAAGLVGGAGVVPGESYSYDVAWFEPGARHSFSDAQGRNIANPTAIVLSAANMLKHMQLENAGKQVEDAVFRTIKSSKVRTRDMSGYATTTEFVSEVIKHL